MHSTTSTTATDTAHSVDSLVEAVLAGSHGPLPSGLTATSVFWIHHGTRLAGGDTTYLNQYVLVRLGASFGGCAFEAGQIDPALCHEYSGAPLDVLLREAPRPLRTAALDAYLGAVRPHTGAAAAGEAEPVVLPAGTPELRAAPGTRPSRACSTSRREPASA